MRLKGCELDFSKSAQRASFPGRWIVTQLLAARRRRSIGIELLVSIISAKGGIDDEKRETREEGTINVSPGAIDLRQEMSLVNLRQRTQAPLSDRIGWTRLDSTDITIEASANPNRLIIQS